MFTLVTDQRDALTFTTAQFGKEQRILLENGVQTHAIRLRLSAPLVVTDKTGGATVNKGSLAACLDFVKIVHGSELHVYNGAQLAYLSEMFAQSQRTTTRVPATAALANTTYNLVEDVVIYFANPFAIKRRETALMEWNPQAYLQLGVTPNANPTTKLIVGAANAALGTITVSVIEEFDRMETQLPWFQTYAEQRAIDVNGTVNGGRYDLPVGADEWLRGILLQQVTDTTGEVSDILNSFRLRDNGRDLIGPTNFVQVDDYQRSLEHKWGGAVYDKSYLPIWFQFDARLSSLHKPQALSLFYNAQASVAGTGNSHINILLLKCKRNLDVNPTTGRRVCDPNPLPFNS